MEKIKLLTRNEVIDLWQHQKNDYKNQYVCPSCRDILSKTDTENVYFCNNPFCAMTEMQYDGNSNDYDSIGLDYENKQENKQ
jgi:hypothetical protein